MTFSEVKHIPIRVWEDSRGFFYESFRDDWNLGSFIQDNVSFSHRNVVRGLHYQLGRPQAKLVRALMGEVMDVIVDIRRSSPTFGQTMTVMLSYRGDSLLIPAGFAHGFVALSGPVAFQYKCSDVYVPACARGIRWNDSALGIDWRIDDKDAILSDADRKHPLLKDAELPD